MRGDLTADEHLHIEGVVDGTIETTTDVIVGTEGRVNANIRAATVLIHGRVIGDVMATNKVELTSTALLQGNIRAPKLAIAELAMFKGSIDMRPAEEPVPSREKKEKKTPVQLEVVES